MQRLKMLGVCALVVALAPGCGKSEEEKAAEQAAEQTKQAAEALRQAAEKTGTAAAAEGMDAAAKALEGLAGALGGATSPDGKPVPPVSFRDLETVLPEVSGWEREKPTGERMTSPVPFSQSEVAYRNGDAQVEVKIVDSAFSSLLVAPWAMFLTAGYERETSDGYEKSVSIGGHPGFEKWNSVSKNGELNLVVAKRFLVTVEGNNINDMAVLRDFVGKIDTGKLATLK